MIPHTEAGKRLLEREAYNSRAFPIIRGDDILDIEAEVAAPLVEALGSAIQWIEATSGCHCPECEDRLIGWKRALDPYLPTARDVFGILSRHDKAGA